MLLFSSSASFSSSSAGSGSSDTGEGQQQATKEAAKERAPPLFQPIPGGKFDKELEPVEEDDEQVSTYNEERGEYYGPRGKEPTR